MKDFPRGGKDTIIQSSRDLSIGKKSGKHKESKSRRKNENNSKTLSETDANYTPNTADCLIYSTLVEGMIILTRVHAVTEYNITVSLPGRIGGQIPITNISESYNNLLQSLVESKGCQQDEFKSLTELYKRGNYLICYVKNTDTAGKYRITLSIEPQLINQSLNLSFLRKGAKIVCSIASIEDHGYVVDTGIKTLRGFLSNNDVHNNLKYYPGQQISCYIKTLKSDENVTTMKLTTKAKSEQSVISDDQPLDGLIPGIRLNLHISKVLSNGLQVTFNECNVGYINQLYLKKPLATYEIGSEISGTLMYILPTVKYAYFSQQSFNNEKNSIEIGEIIEDAPVLFREPRGVVFSLKKGIRGFLSFKRVKIDHEKINEVFTPNSVHTCRIISYEMFDRIYICSMQQSVIKGNTLILEAARPGDKTIVEIIKINDNGFLSIKSGSSIGNVAPEHIYDVDEEEMKPLKIGDKVEARVLGHHTQGNGLMFTLKKSLVNSKKPILSNINDAKIEAKYEAVVISVRKEGLLVKFYGNLKGWIPAKLLDKKVGGTKNYVHGQVVAVKIKEIDKEKERLILALYDKTTKMKKKEVDISKELKIGNLVEGTVVESSINGVYIRIKMNNDSDTVTGFLPAGHMAPCTEIGTYLSTKYVPGDKLSALVFSITPELLLSRTFTLQKESTSFNNLKVNECIPCYIKEVSTNGLKVILSIEDFDDYGIVHYQKIDNIEVLSTNQLIFGKIIGINRKEKKVFLTTSLHEIWTEILKNNSDMIAAVDLLTLYFSKLKELCNHDCYKNKKIVSMHLGQRMSGIVDQVTDHGLIVKLENDVIATVRQNHFYGIFSKGDEVTGSVLWINYIHEIVEITLIPALVNKITIKQKKLLEASTEVQLRGEILLVTNWFILVLLKGQAKGTLAALPSRRHINDLEPNLRHYSVGKEIRCYAILGKNKTDLLPICLVKSAFETKQSALIQKNDLKRKIEKDREDNRTNKKVKRFEVSNIHVNDLIEKENQPNGDDKTIKIEITKEQKKNENKNVCEDVKNLSIPECNFFWDSKPDLELLRQLSSDSEDDDEENIKPKLKKKKLNAAERRDLEKQKEREIREREEALVHNKVPNSADHFDRLVLAEPNSSIIWMQYMAYHLQATEIEKARVIVKRALKTINFREEAEKLNIWKAWLNLESRFGSPESLNDVFHQALNATDSKIIYLHMLTVHLDAKRQAELEKTVKTIVGKFKDDCEVWIECGTTLVKLGLKEKSRLLMQQALQYLPISKHVYLMVKFAQAENNYGDKERAKTLFENILTSYPKRVDVWSTYVDFLVKDKDYEIARKVLEKAVAQTLPPKKMKTLFKKYVAFEEQHGTPDGVEYAKKLAVSYIENLTKNPTNE